MGKRNKKKLTQCENVEFSKGNLDYVDDADAEAPPHKDAVKATKSKFCIEQLLDKAEEYIETFEFELAQRFCKRALEVDADNVRALETSGTLLLELGQHEKARECFLRAVELSPEEGHSKYMYLGQLAVAHDALGFFRKGIALMHKRMDRHNSQAAGAAAYHESEITGSDLSRAYCSVAEIYLTDLCEEEDAETQCQACLETAIEQDERNPEAYQLIASFWLSKHDKEKAREMIERGVDIWLPMLRDFNQPEGSAIDPVQACPVSYPARMSAAKLLIEVENFELSSEILELLLDEEDQVVEVWYLLGWLNYLQGSDYYGNARYYLAKAKEVVVKTGFDEKEVIEHIDKLLDEMGPGNEDEEKEEEANDDDDGESEADTDDDMEVEDAEH